MLIILLLSCPIRLIMGSSNLSLYVKRFNVINRNNVIQHWWISCKFLKNCNASRARISLTKLSSASVVYLRCYCSSEINRWSILPHECHYQLTIKWPYRQCHKHHFYIPKISSTAGLGMISFAYLSTQVPRTIVCITWRLSTCHYYCIVLFFENCWNLLFAFPSLSSDG